MPVRVRHSIVRLAAALLVPAALLVWLPVPAGTAAGTGSVQSRLERQRAHTQTLSGQVAALNATIDRLSAGIAAIEGREADVRAQLARTRAQLARTQRELGVQRHRARVLARRLAHARHVLAARLRALYVDGQPDFLSVLVNARSFADLVDEAEFLKHIDGQDRAVIDGVRRARAATRRATVRLSSLQAVQRRSEAAAQAQSAALASMNAALSERRARVTAARAAEAGALASSRGRAQRLARELASLRAAEARAAAQTSSGNAPAGGSGGWAIPWPIVQCESGGQNLPPNGAGASGYYQIVPGTWKGNGGSTAQAYQADRAEQDRVAARIWNGGRGAGLWDCAAMVGIH